MAATPPHPTDRPDELAGTPVLVLGGRGYLGRHVCSAFAAAGARWCASRAARAATGTRTAAGRYAWTWPRPARRSWLGCAPAPGRAWW